MLKKKCQIFVFHRNRVVWNLKIENGKQKKQGFVIHLEARESIGTLTLLTVSIHYH
jgi:hypothetical protein